MSRMNFLILISICLLLIIVFVYSNCSRKEKIEKVDTFINLSTLEAVGFNKQIWQDIDKDILEGNYGLMNSVLVIYDDQLILEKYYNGWERNKLHDIQSATKSVTSALIGIAIEKGFIKSIHQKMVDFFPQYKWNPADPLKKDITLQNMLTMTDGLEWDEHSKKYYDPGNSLTDMYNHRVDWVEYLLELPVIEKPGTQFNYNSGISILLGSILQNSSKMKVQNFAEEYLFKPLDIKKYHWSEYFGLAHCGGGLYLSPIDMAKIGYLYYNNGKWANKQVILESWVKESLLPKYKSGTITHYGYQWWSIDSIFNLKPISFAGGNGWQFIFIIKEFNMLIVFTGKNYAQEAPRTTFSQNELLFGILVCNPQFKKQIISIYEKQINNASESENIYKIFVLAYSLNKLGEYEKTIEYLNLFIQKYSDDLYFNYFIGEAYFKVGDFINAKLHLNKCITINDAKELPKEGYYKLADKILKNLNNNSI